MRPCFRAVLLCCRYCRTNNVWITQTPKAQPLNALSTNHPQAPGPRKTL
jgi:hypothetical protein